MVMVRVDLVEQMEEIQIKIQVLLVQLLQVVRMAPVVEGLRILPTAVQVTALAAL